jgi:quinoprotein glucose dehydrogenase
MSRIVRPLIVHLLLVSALAAADSPPALVAAAAPAGVEIPAGTTLQLAATAKEQHLESPTALAFDEAGRIFVTETHRLGHGVEDDRKHPDWYLDDLAAQKTSERLALYEKWKAQVPHSYLTEKSERVRRLADRDGDGVFEESTVFADGFNAPLDGAIGGVFAHQGGTYVACIPNLWLLRDANGDGVADERKTLQDGFGVRISLAGHDLRGFTLGPDGRLYGTLGDRGLSLTTKEGKTYQYPNEGCAFRIEADGSGFEVFHTGLRNPRGLVFDAFGNAFTVESSSGLGDAPRLIYLVYGGDSGWQMEHQTLHDFHRQIGLTELPPNRWMDEHMWELRHPLQPAYILPPAAHLTVNPLALASHSGTGFLAAEAGRFLVCDQGSDAAHSGIGSFDVKPEGAGMQVTDFRQVLRGIAATAIAYAWDGRLFIIDGGNEQIFSLNAGAGSWRASEAAETAKLIREGFEQRDSAELAMLLKHPDFRVRLRAQIALTRQADALARFSAAIASGDVMERIHGVWGIGILARRGSGVPLPGDAVFGDVPANKVRLAAGQKLAELLSNPDAEVRAQAARAIGDAPNQFIRPRDPSKGRGLPGGGAVVTAEGLPLAALLFDESPRVRYFAAISIGKLKALGFYSSICDFLKANDNRDPYLRHAGAFALQHIVTSSLMLSGLERHPSPAVRLGATIALRRMRDPAVATFIHDPDPQVADEAIRAVTDLSLDQVRDPLGMLLDNLAARPWQPFMLRRLIHNAFRLGTAKDAARLLKLVGDPAIPVAIQKESLRLLALWVVPPAVDQLTGHWRPLAHRDPATIKPALNAALPRLLQQDGFIRAAALELSKQYQLEAPAADLPNTPKVPATDPP